MRDTLQTYADFSIRRACAFSALAVTTVMMALSYDVALALNVGAQLLAVLVLGLLVAAWRAPRRDLRHSEVYVLLKEAGLPRGRLASAEMKHEIAAVLRHRLIWHAERVGAVTIALGTASLALRLFA